MTKAGRQEEKQIGSTRRSVIDVLIAFFPAFLSSSFVIFLIPIVSFLLVVSPVRSADNELTREPRPEDHVTMDRTTKRATARALEWLALTQRADGSWGNTAITSFALLAFLSQGHIPNEGPYGVQVAKGYHFLLASARERDGSLVGTRLENPLFYMYCHGMSTLTLAELWGMTGDEEIKPVLKRAVRLIISSQNALGGWRYSTTSTDADVSVTIMQVMALRAAKNSGLEVPDDTLKRAIAYIEKCYDERTGGFRYMTDAPNKPEAGFARTAAGACVLQLSGRYDARQIPKAINYLKAHFDDREHFWYGHYYAAHAMHQVGGHDWEDWYDRLKITLLAKQSPDGSWGSHEVQKTIETDPVYETSIAVIVLSIPCHYLPIFQR